MTDEPTRLSTLRVDAVRSLLEQVRLEIFAVENQGSATLIPQTAARPDGGSDPLPIVRATLQGRTAHLRLDQFLALRSWGIGFDFDLPEASDAFATLIARNAAKRLAYDREDVWTPLAEWLPPGGVRTGWRINSEVPPIQWRQIDLRVGEVRLNPGTTKNREGRVFYLTPELHQLLKEQRAVADEIQRQKKMIVQHVFFHRPVTKAGALGHFSRPPYLRVRLLPGLAAGPDVGRMPRQHSARLPANGHPQHGPGRDSGARGHEIERPQDSQRVRSL